MKPLASILVLLLALAPAWIRAEELPETLQVEVFIFSGRSPPKYFVTDAKQIEAIFKLVDSAPVVNMTKKGGILGSDSGYKGFRIHNSTKRHPEMEDILVYRTDLEIWKNTATKDPDQQFRTDAGSKLQRYLLRLLEQANVASPSVLHWIKYGHVTKVIPGKTLE